MKGLVFTLDAIVAFGIIVTIIGGLIFFRTEIVSPYLAAQRLHSISEDVLGVLYNSKLGDIVNKSLLDQYIADGTLDEEDLDKKTVDIIGALWAAEKKEEVSNITKDIIENFIPNNTGYQILINNDNVYNSSFSREPKYEDAYIRISSGRIISGYEKYKPVSGYVARAWATKVKKTTTKIIPINLAWGGSSDGEAPEVKSNKGYGPPGERNRWAILIKNFTIPNDANISYAYMQMALDNDCTHIEINDSEVFDRCCFGCNRGDIREFDVTNYVQPGLNEINISFRQTNYDDLAHFHPGCFIKINYNTSEVESGSNKTVFNAAWLRGAPSANQIIPFFVNAPIKNVTAFVDIEDINAFLLLTLNYRYNISDPRQNVLLYREYPPPPPTAWCSGTYCNSSWKRRINLTMKNSGGDVLNDFPILVVLNSSIIDYSYFKNDGSDIRFTDPVGSQLDYHIQLWNNTGDSFIWVEVPQIESTDTDFIWMYYNNSNASDASDEQGTYNDNFVGVWHLDETFGDYEDSTSNNQDSTAENPDSRNNYGIIGKAPFFDDMNEYVNLPDTINDGEFAVEVWFKPNWNGNDGNPHSILDMTYDPDNRYFYIAKTSNDILRFYFESDNDADVQCAYDISSAVTSNNWYYVVGVGEFSVPWSEWHYMYLNGNQVESDQANGYVDEKGTLADSMRLGSPGATYHVPQGPADALIDEIRISKTRHSDGWIEASYSTMKNTFLIYGSPQNYIPGMPEQEEDIKDRQYEIFFNETGTLIKEYKPEGNLLNKWFNTNVTFNDIHNNMTNTLGIYADIRPPQNISTDNGMDWQRLGMFAHNDTAGHGDDHYCFINKKSNVTVHHKRERYGLEYGKIDITVIENFTDQEKNCISKNVNSCKDSFLNLTFPFSTNIIKGKILGTQEWGGHDNGYNFIWMWINDTESEEANLVMDTDTPPGTFSSVPVQFLQTNQINVIRVGDKDDGRHLETEISPLMGNKRSIVDYTFLIPSQVGYGEVFENETDAIDDAETRLNQILGSFATATLIQKDSFRVGGVPYMYGPYSFRVNVWV